MVKRELNKFAFSIIGFTEKGKNAFRRERKRDEEKKEITIDLNNEMKFS